MESGSPSHPQPGVRERVENIDPVLLLGPAAIVAFSFGLAGYWRARRRLTAWVVLVSLVAYFGAIAAKAVFQEATYGPLDSAVKGSPWALGPYFGLQTAILEVGLAYLLARYAVRKGVFHANDAEGYGISLALWENGVLLGGLTLVEYVAYYVVLSGQGPGAQQLYATLSQAAPSLFYAPSAAAALVGYSVLERVSSLLLHFSWGYLAVLAAVYKKRRLLAAALHMGLVDALVPFAGELGIGAFEAMLFAISLLCLLVALRGTRGAYRRASVEFAPTPTGPGTANLRRLIVTDFRRALSFGKVYVAIGMVLPLLLVAELTVVGKAPSGGTAGAQLPAILGELYPLLLPVFTVMGATGTLMIFASDRDKGVYEYMLAYGVDVSTVFWSMLVATLGLVTVVLGGSLLITVAALAATDPRALNLVFFELLALYTAPLSYVVAAFMAMAGMIWSQLTVRRSGVNSPVGVAPMLGVAPVLLVLLLALGPGSGHILYVVGGSVLVMAVAVAVMASLANSRMQRERFLSNA